MRIAVAGGTGVVGRHVVDETVAAGHTPVVLTRSHGVDLVAGAGLDGALDGADVVIDVSNVTTTRRSSSIRFFRTVTTNLLAAGTRAGVRHHVVLSIVGVDRVSFGYYEGKLAQERTALAGPVPVTVLRTAPFHEFAEQTLNRVRGPVALVPRQRIRPVASREVASALVALAVGSAQGYATEMVGPDEHELVDLSRRLLRARGSRRVVVGVRLPGPAGRAMESGALLPVGDVRVGHLTFDEWLARPGEPGPPPRA